MKTDNLLHEKQVVLVFNGLATFPVIFISIFVGTCNS